MNKDLNADEIKKVIQNSELPDDLKEKLINELPELLEGVGEAARTVYDPNAIWLEAIQYADYMDQHIKHLANSHMQECGEDSVKTMAGMTIMFKQMAESAMRVLDTLKIESDLTDWNTVKITYRKANDAQ